MPDKLFLWIAAFYRDGAYFAGSKIAGILCSLADIAMIWMFLKLADTLRGQKSSVWRYRALIAFILLTPTLLLPEISTHFFIVQFLVLGLPYLLLAHAVVTEMPRILAHIRQHVQKMRNDS